MSTPRPSLSRRSAFLRLAMFAVPLVMASALVAVWRLRPSQDEGRTAHGPASDLPAQMEQMQSELKLLRRHVQVMSRQESAAKAVTAAASAADVAPPAPPLTQEEASARDKRRFEGLAGKLAAEPVDRSWGPATERLITDTIKKPAFKGTRLLEATCRSTLCRLEVSHETEADRRKFSSTLPTRLPTLPSGSMRNAEGPDRKTIIYVAREGHRVPRDEPQ